MTAKETAIQDIQEECRHLGKCFLAFSKVLDSPINAIVDEQLKEQQHLIRKTIK